MNERKYYIGANGAKIDIGVDFYEDTHTYIRKSNGKQYTSCTTMLGKFKPKFDTDLQASKFAARNGLDYNDVIKDWEDKKNQACNYGNEIHQFMEDYINFSRHGEFKPDVNDYHQYSHGNIKLGILAKSFNWIIDNMFKRVGVEDIIPEGLLWNDQYEIAGMSDIIINHPNNTFSILDFKTNNKYRYWSDFNEKMLAPLEYMHVCEHSTYSLQMSIYALFYSIITGRKLHCNMILYLDRKNSVWKPIHCTYLMHQAMDVLQQYATKQQ